MKILEDRVCWLEGNIVMYEEYFNLQGCLDRIQRENDVEKGEDYFRDREEDLYADAGEGLYANSNL